jgi:SpoIID/LytB domain protein
MLVPSAQAGSAPSTFTLYGSGFGHGVGMSQYGAKAFAAAGKSADQIIAHYYTGAVAAPVRDDMNVRVNVLHAVSSATLKGVPLASGGGKLHVGVDGTWGMVGAAADTWTISPSGSSVVVKRNGGTVRSGAKVTFLWGGTRYPGSTGNISSLISVNGTTYRHGFVTAQVVNGKLEVVVNLRLGDEYLYGLGEMPSSWPGAALQAQVIAARSFAVLKYGAGVRSACACHLYDGTSDQVYVGWSKQSGSYGSAWTAAVNATSTGSTTGKAVTYGGKPVSAYYFSSSGGRTQNSEEVWSSVLPYARSVADPGATESSNPYRAWSRSITQAKMAAAFGLTDVVRLDLSARTVGGGVKRAIAWSSTGRSASITGEKLRTSLGLPSTWVLRQGDRVAGADRYATAVAVAKAAVPTGSTVVIASGEAEHLVDGMVAAPLAKSLGAPLLLARAGGLPSVTTAELKRRGARTAYVIGSTGALSDAVVTGLTAAGVTKVVRLAGVDRYETAAAVARAMDVPEGRPVLVVNGAALADALGAGGAAAGSGRPIVLVTRDGLPTPTRQLLDEIRPVAATIVGGTAQVGAAVAAQLPTAWRANGSDRFETASEVARAFRSIVPTTPVLLAAGVDAHLVDALPAGAWGRLVLLTQPGGLPGAASVWLQTTPGVHEVVAVGAKAPVSDAALLAAMRA